MYILSLRFKRLQCDHITATTRNCTYNKSKKNLKLISTNTPAFHVFTQFQNIKAFFNKGFADFFNSTTFSCTMRLGQNHNNNNKNINRITNILFQCALLFDSFHILNFQIVYEFIYKYQRKPPDFG